MYLRKNKKKYCSAAIGRKRGWRFTSLETGCPFKKFWNSQYIIIIIILTHFLWEARSYDNTRYQVKMHIHDEDNFSQFSDFINWFHNSFQYIITIETDAKTPHSPQAKVESTCLPLRSEFDLWILPYQYMLVFSNACWSVDLYTLTLYMEKSFNKFPIWSTGPSNHEWRYQIKRNIWSFLLTG